MYLIRWFLELIFKFYYLIQIWGKIQVINYCKLPYINPGPIGILKHILGTYIRGGGLYSEGILCSCLRMKTSKSIIILLKHRQTDLTSTPFRLVGSKWPAALHICIQNPNCIYWTVQFLRFGWTTIPTMTSSFLVSLCVPFNPIPTGLFWDWEHWGEIRMTLTF